MDQEELYQKMVTKVIVFLAYKPRTRKEVATRLARYLQSHTRSSDVVKEAVTRQIFDYLAANKLIDDEDYTRLFIAAKTAGTKALGRRAIEIKLIAKGIAKDEAARYVGAAITDEAELKAAIGLLTRKFGATLGRSSSVLQDKAGRYLISRGFAFATARQAVDYLVKRP
jgi:SOS response regulatory protein OraA/RecX